ncbi:4'-phosphopantetheinyl transferase superfamily protein [Micromonospora sp. DSM 115977]|uniref:4'-phosphopantetheinyl transferase superfamily protein n=1 Tax=Micromonospora reichwaldensis TaxID=3075516 RepID=A0ABU2WYT5_9ACTN|nr:4'-phosphopantetheinyl transferase superfamily protein [Micromonospora sp. DSM 115977]MDT0530690.1 4'-phosphopantetheinyl transferase superfamily protein [Micromonospora sp. DSM 115977]
MSQLPVPGRDTAYVWIGRGVGGRPVPAGRLLRRAGAALLGRAEAEIVVEHGRDGRPLVTVSGAGARVELPVSVSRADGVVAVAARAAGPVGIDVEWCRPLPALALAGRWFAPAEAAWLAERDADGRARDFLRLWTAKEAVGKALGTGLRGDGLRRLMPVPDDPDAALRPVPGAFDDAWRPVPDDLDAGLRSALGGRRLRVGHPRVGGCLVLAVAVVADEAVPVHVVSVGALLVRAVPVGSARVGSDGAVGVARCRAHVAAARSASVERTSLPVVVRGS